MGGPRGLFFYAHGRTHFKKPGGENLLKPIFFSPNGRTFTFFQILPGPLKQEKNPLLTANHFSLQVRKVDDFVF